MFHETHKCLTIGSTSRLSDCCWISPIDLGQTVWLTYITVVYDSWDVSDKKLENWSTHNTGKTVRLSSSLCQTPQPGGAGVGPHGLWYLPVRGQRGEVILHPQQPEECHRSRWVTMNFFMFLRSLASRARITVGEGIWLLSHKQNSGHIFH